GAAAQQRESRRRGEPLAVPHIRLAARHHLDVLGIDQEELDAPLQEIVDGAPVDACRLHHDVLPQQTGSRSMPSLPRPRPWRGGYGSSIAGGAAAAASGWEPTSLSELLPAGRLSRSSRGTPASTPRTFPGSPSPVRP